MRSPRFEPGSSAWQADVLDHSSEDFLRISNFSQEVSVTRLRPHIDALIANTLIKLQNDAKAHTTIKTTEYALRNLSLHVDLSKPEEVKQYVANSKTKTGKPTTAETKNKWLCCYANFCKYNEIKWTKPYYKVAENTPLIPTPQDVQAIINNSSQNYATVFTILAETGAEPQELYQTTQKHINIEKGEISITGTKGHGSKTYKLKPQTIEMLRTYLAKHLQEHPFPQAHSQSQAWQKYKKRTAKKLSKPELLRIQLRNLRNYSGERFYKNLPIRDPIALMRHFRHKKLETTMHYIRAIIIDYDEDEQYISRTSTTLEEDGKLIESGFQYVTERDGTKLYRKRK